MNKTPIRTEEATPVDTTPAPTPPELLTLEDAFAMSNEKVAELFKAHLNPAQYGLFRLLGFHKITLSKAEGMYYYDQNGRAILDFFGGFGSIALGHNHPRILAARKRFQEEKRHEIAIAFMSQYAATLAHNLAQIAPGTLDHVFLSTAGSEAVEYALKIAERVAGSGRKKILFAEKAFHGKTRGSLSITDSPLYQNDFTLMTTTVKVPFGDIDALRRRLEGDPEIGVLILETIQGGAGIITAPPDYWQEVRRLCDEHKVVWIADEVQCGVGRTGKFFAFEHAGVVPDVVTLAKSLGGGKAAVGAVITRKDFYMQAYGDPKTAIIHAQATFGGMGESCATAIETLNTIYDDGLLENAAKQGALLISELKRLQAKFPHMIKEVRGEGLMVGLEFQDFSQTMPGLFRGVLSKADDKLKGSLCGFIGSILLRDYDILVAFTEYNRNVIRLEPPLIVTEEEVRRFIAALEKLMGRGVTAIATSYVKGFVTQGG
ncbi:aspartate aminotransferase family protein [uncultured Roseobacter sp.]|uniref:aspartate aminotransferase family protein n=1 Tax=uncultured Roseobacter sp. TaxID=114847 RepID=UPI002634169F|nr:aspartate aminotransferase family protein [uncultured Roseobacter sp.]